MTWIRRWADRTDPSTSQVEDDEVARLRRLVQSLESTCQFQQEHIKDLARKLQMNEDFLRLVGNYAESSDSEVPSA